MASRCDVTGYEFKWGAPRSYGPLGILETLVKLLATGVSIASLSVYMYNSYPVYTTYRIIAGTFISFESLFYLIQFVHRIIDKEMFAIIFMLLVLFGNVILNVVAFVSIEGDSGAYIFVVSLLMLLGELIKIMHVLLVDEASIKWPIYFNRRIVLAISAINTVAWAAVFVTEILALVISFSGTNQQA